MSFIVCAYYTPDYKKDVSNLRGSIEDLSLPFYEKEYESRGEWALNTGIKPEFILHCLEKYPDLDVLYLDADCVLRKEPEILSGLREDLAIVYTPDGQGYSHKILTGTLWVKNSDKSKEFLRTWISAQAESLEYVDQDSFELAVDRHDINIYKLPLSYAKIFDWPGPEAVVEHFQASRRLKEARREIRYARRRRTNYILGGASILVLIGVSFFLSSR